MDAMDIENQSLDTKSLLRIFESEVCSQSQSIDEDNDVDFRSLAIGWAVAKGLSPKEARLFAIEVKFSYFW